MKLVVAAITVTSPVAAAPMPLTMALTRQRRPFQAPPVHDHAGLRQGERGKYRDRVQRQQGFGRPAEHDDQQGAEHAQHQDAVRERQPLTAERELFGRVVVARQQRRQARKVGDRRYWPPGPGSAPPKTGPRSTADRSPKTAWASSEMTDSSWRGMIWPADDQERQAEEHHRQDGGHRHDGLRGVASTRAA